MAQNIQTMSASKVWGIIQTHEKELAILVKQGDARSCERAVQEYKETLKANYEHLLLNELEFSYSKDIDYHLWKSLFHRKIDECRKNIKQSQGSEEKHRTTSEFLEFLSESIAYYETLFQRLRDHYINQIGPDVVMSPIPLPTTPKPKGSEDKEDIPITAKASTMLYKCLIYLGDLARYMIHTGKKRDSQWKDWSQVESIYLSAVHICPDNGNAHNQLAVVATYKLNDFEALYRYYRSIACRRPFLAAHDNVMATFETFASKFEQLLQTETPNAKQRKITFDHDSIDRVAQKPSEQLQKDFFTLFGKIHASFMVQPEEAMGALRSYCFTHMQHMVQRGLLPPDLLLKVFVINICTVENLRNKLPEGYDTRRVIGQASCFACESFNTVMNAVALEKVGHYIGCFSMFLHWVLKAPALQDEDVQSSLSRLLEAVVSLGNLMPMQDARIDSSTGVLLEEDIELKGFIFAIDLVHPPPNIAQINDTAQLHALGKIQRVRRLHLVIEAFLQADLLVFDRTQLRYYLRKDAPAHLVSTTFIPLPSFSSRMPKNANGDLTPQKRTLTPPPELFSPVRSPLGLPMPRNGTPPPQPMDGSPIPAMRGPPGNFQAVRQFADPSPSVQKRFSRGFATELALDRDQIAPEAPTPEFAAPVDHGGIGAILQRSFSSRVTPSPPMKQSPLAYSLENSNPFFYAPTFPKTQPPSLRDSNTTTRRSTSSMDTNPTKPHTPMSSTGSMFGEMLGMAHRVDEQSDIERSDWLEQFVDTVLQHQNAPDYPSFPP